MAMVSDSGEVSVRVARCSSTGRKASRCSSAGQFMGRENLDIMRHLHAMNMLHVTSKILAYIPAGDLCNVSRVSRPWRSCISRDLESTKRKRNFLKTQKLNMENFCSPSPTQFFGSPRKRTAMSNRTNLIVKSPTTRKREREASQHIKVSPSKVRHHLFTQAASKLSPGEQLQRCPRCSSPSRVMQSRLTAKCTRISCSFDYCTRCICRNHGDSPCRPTTKSTGLTTKGTAASKKSKRRLRRL